MDYMDTDQPDHGPRHSLPKIHHDILQNVLQCMWYAEYYFVTFLAGYRKIFIA